MSSLVHLRDDDPDLLNRLQEVRAGGDVPLVLDGRAADAQVSAISAVTEQADLSGIGWAALTSGSSGTPRVVLRSAESWAASFAAVAELLGAGPADAVALTAPASSSLTLFSLAHALGGGPRPLLGDMTEATCFHGTPEGLRRLLESCSAPHLRSALVGGSRLDPGLRSAAEAAGVQVTAYYGAAELSFVAIDRGDGLEAFPGVELEVRDGLLWVSSPFVVARYAGAPGPLRREGRWATVGDRAELVRDAGGAQRLRLLGRADDAILSASATIVPEEVESTLRAVPGVRDAVVFGVPAGRIGALVAAMVEPDGPSLALSALRAAASENLAPAHRPRRWYAGELPRTASGKPARAEVLRLVLDGEVRALDH